MMRALFAAVSGLRNHQVEMDVIGNNIANVNTVAFKASRVTFKESFAQILQGATRPPGGSTNVAAGRNPIQVGLGMNVSSIDLQFTQGSLETTGVTTDLAIQGDSFFVVSNGNKNYYTRAGAFQLDASGRLVFSANGYVVQGRTATNGILNQTIGDLTLPFGQKSPASATTTTKLGGNLDAAAAAGDIRSTTITIYDEQGGKHDLTIEFTKNSNPNEWDYVITATGEDPAVPFTNDTGTVVFNQDGSLASPATVSFGFTPLGFTSGQTVDIEFGTANAVDGLSQFASASTAVLRDQDGYTMGLLERISIDASGTIEGSFTNGTNLTLGQIALADFNNPTGLIRDGDNLYSTSPNSGGAVLGFPGEGSQSIIQSGALEMSNVDLSQEFTNLITAQRGFQSSARVITASDEMLQELVNLKR